MLIVVRREVTYFRERFNVFISSVNGNVQPKCCTGWVFRASKERVAALTSTKLFLSNGKKMRILVVSHCRFWLSMVAKVGAVVRMGGRGCVIWLHGCESSGRDSVA